MQHPVLFRCSGALMIFVEPCAGPCSRLDRKSDISHRRAQNVAHDLDTSIKFHASPTWLSSTTSLCTALFPSLSLTPQPSKYLTRQARGYWLAMANPLAPRPLPSVLLFSLVPIASWFIVRPLIEPIPALPALHVSLGLSIFALLLTLYLVPALGPTFIQANLKGKDLLKTYYNPMYAGPINNVSECSLLTTHIDRKVSDSSVPRYTSSCSSSSFHSHSPRSR